MTSHSAELSQTLELLANVEKRNAYLEGELKKCKAEIAELQLFKQQAQQELLKFNASSRCSSPPHKKANNSSLPSSCMIPPVSKSSSEPGVRESPAYASKNSSAPTMCPQTSTTNSMSSALQAKLKTKATNSLSKSQTSSPSLSLPQPSNSLDQILVRYDAKNPQAVPHAPNEYRELMFEGLVSYENTDEIQSKDIFRIKNYNHSLVGSKVCGDFNSTSGKRRVGDNISGHYRRETVTYHLTFDAAQSGHGHLNWFLCCDRKPLECDEEFVKKLVERNPLGGEDVVYGLKLVSTTTTEPEKESKIQLWSCGSLTNFWIEVEREDGDACVKWCRFYGMN